MRRPKYTPMIEQYLSIKEQNKDFLIMFRLGDFYEFFFEDAEIASKVLQLVLTKRAAGNKQKIPMCGVPHHAVTSYLAKLVDHGYKVGIVEQLEDPSEAKGIVERDIVRIVTPGAIIDYDEGPNNYIIAIDEGKDEYHLAYADISTGEINVTNLEKDALSLASFISNLNSKEIVVRKEFPSKVLSNLKTHMNIVVSYEDNDYQAGLYDEIFSDVNDIDLIKVGTRLINYLVKIQRRDLTYLKPIVVSRAKESLLIDAFSRTNLELTRTIRSDEKYGSLFWLLDDTATAMGRRLLKSWINRPSRDEEEINRRLNIVDTLIKNFIVREEIRLSLQQMYDLERIIAKVSFGNVNPRDLLQLLQSLEAFKPIKQKLNVLKNIHLNELLDKCDDFAFLIKLLQRSIREDAPLTINEGGIFKQDYHEGLDELIDLTKGGRRWITQFEETEREKTGIKNLKVGYNSVFGYYIEISNSFLPQVKDEWGYVRRQTTKGGERFINQDLKEKEALILSAEEKRQVLEKQLFIELQKEIQTYTRQIQRLSMVISEIDVLCSFAKISANNQYVRPSFNHKRLVIIKEGKHPVIDKVLQKNQYVANDILLDKNTDMLLITGPNMGGKSTYMRQLALIVIMAQMGCYVPAKEANLMIFDQIFTRIGASDDLISGQSTFMVEISEANYALRKATVNSLLLFDEIGRGTSTYDGMALAQSMIEYVATNVKAKMLFSTHYHELTMLEDKLPTLKNVHVEVKEQVDEVTFLYKVKEGAMGKSYGVNVAVLAGLPLDVVNRARQILRDLEKERQQFIPTKQIKEDIKEDPKWLIDLKNIEPSRLTPLEALQYLYEIKKELDNE
ncbi:MAG: DNA mismatch repair protein MutS [Erysipelotrichaceae bacterium]|jgi:DNA mismatch repair protein MutS|nr:DNA mismatch repair protein MutS [Bacillota bacterium]NLJ32434.1 DNA mismatch repair protein MutS [Erysipelotrichaceae bacterium]